jgi:Domain of unknown function DUF29
VAAPTRQARASWRKSLRTQRRQIKDLLQESPSLRRVIPELVRETSSDGAKNAAVVPADCPYAPDEVLAEDHLPDANF